MIDISDGVTTITVHDTWSRTDTKTLLIGRTSTLTGAEFDYKWGKVDGYALSFQNIPSSDADQLNSWWQQIPK